MRTYRFVYAIKNSGDKVRTVTVQPATGFKAAEKVLRTVYRGPLSCVVSVRRELII